MSEPRDYTFNDTFQVTEEVKRAFEDDGYTLIRGLLSKQEVDHVEKALNVGPFAEHTYGVPSGDGKEAHIIAWRHPGNDVTGMLARCEKVTTTCEQLMGGEVYHYHTKLMKKPAEIGGKHIWHQDYGYWYVNNLFPDLMTVFIAVDKCTKENSCLQVLKGSHKCGRIDHVMVGERTQTGADMARVDEVAKVCPLQYVEMEPGDALFFHCNLLHCSSDNKSSMRRWAFLCAYNMKRNNPFRKHYHPFYTPIHKVKDSAILECQDFTNMEGKMFLDFAKEYPAGRKIPLDEQ